MGTEKKKTGFFHKHWPEIVLIGLVFCMSLSCILYFTLKKAPENLSATVSCPPNELTLRLDLSQETKERDIEIEGAKTPMTIRVKHNAICVAKSGCPSQYCVNLHYVSSPSTPIVCAYNQVTILLSGESSGEIEI